MKLSVKLIPSNDEIIANCPELDINCYAASRDEAIRRIRDVIHFYVDSAKELGLEVESLTEISIDGDRGIPLEDATVSEHPHSIH